MTKYVHRRIQYLFVPEQVAMTFFALIVEVFTFDKLQNREVYTSLSLRKIDNDTRAHLNTFGLLSINQFALTLNRHFVFESYCLFRQSDYLNVEG